MPHLPHLSHLSRLLGVGPRFQHTLLGLLHLGYKCRLRLPLFISAGFVLCHIFSVYLPTVEINVEVVEERGPDPGDLGEETDELSLGEEEEEEEDEYDEEEEESDTDLAAAVVHLLHPRPE